MTTFRDAELEAQAALAEDERERKKLNGSGRCEPPARSAELVVLDSVPTEEVRWLWEPYIPIRKLTLLQGDPGLGKTWLALAFASAVSLGEALPGGTRGEPGPVLYATAEDGLGDTMRPRLEAMGADLLRIVMLDGIRIENGEVTSFTLADIPVLDEALAKVKPRLLVIDPIQAYLGAGVDAHRANEVRPVLQRVARLAEKHAVAVLVVMHLRKAGSEKAIYRGLGSIDFVAAARSVLVVAEHPDTERAEKGIRIFAQSKNSLAPKGPSREFALIDGCLEWRGESDYSAEEILVGSGKSQSAADVAEEYLEGMLKGQGRVSSSMIFKVAQAAGISDATLRRAKKKLDVESEKTGFGQRGEWYWSLPPALRCSNPPIGENEHLSAEDAGEGTRAQSGGADDHLSESVKSPADECGEVAAPPAEQIDLAESVERAEQALGAQPTEEQPELELRDAEPSIARTPFGALDGEEPF